MKHHAIQLSCALFALTACQTRKEQPPPPPPPPTIAPALADSTLADSTLADSTLAEHMDGHFEAISALERAIVRGRLADAQGLARSLNGHAEPTPAAWKPFVDEMNAAAAAVERAPDLPSAAALAARLGRACSRCHEAQQAIVTFAWEPMPEGDDSLQLQMRRHEWAAARLWEGLVGPSDDMWTQGTAALATLDLDTFAASRGVPRGDIEALAKQVHELATKAGTTTDHEARAALYGELLSTCAGCHQLVRPVPAP